MTSARWLDMNYPYCIYRSRLGPAIFAVAPGVMFVAFVLGMSGVLPIGGADHIVFVLFAFGFLLPISLWSTYLLIDRRPILTLDRDTVTFRHQVFRWRAVEIRAADILSSTTRRKSLADGSLCDLVIEVTPEYLATLAWKGVLRKRGRFLFFGFTPAAIGPDEAAVLLNRHLAIASATADGRPAGTPRRRPQISGIGSWPGSRVRYVIAGFNLLYAGVMLFMAITGWTPAGMAPGPVTATCMIVLIVSLVPFIITYTELGLNEDSGAAYEESQERHAILAGHLPFWAYVFPSFIVVALLSLLLLRRLVNPFLVVFAGVSLISFTWFAFVYPTARSVLDEDDEG